MRAMVVTVILLLCACQRQSAMVDTSTDNGAEIGATTADTSAPTAPSAPDSLKGQRIKLATRMRACDHVTDDASYQRSRLQALLPLANHLALRRDGGMTWNKVDVSLMRLKGLLDASAALNPKPYLVIDNQGLGGEQLLAVENVVVASDFCK